MEPINFFNTHISRSASDEIAQVLNTTFLSEGKVVKEFEKKLSPILGTNHVVAVNSGTSALHLALVLAGIGEGDEVICPAQTFIASALAIRYVGATPVFVDIDYETGNIAFDSIRESISSKTKAILIVDWGGLPCNIEQIMNLARSRSIVVIEDAAHALGATYQGRPIGSVCDYTCFSFQAIKQVTTGDGGAVCTLREDKYEEARRRRWFGIDRANATPSPLGERQFELKEIGFKYHLNDYSAALGIANLKEYPARLARVRHIANRYLSELNKVAGFSPFRNFPDRESAYWLFGAHVEKRSAFIAALASKGIPTSVVHQRIDRYSVLGGITPNLKCQERFDETQIHIPLHAALTEEQVTYVVDVIKQGW